MSAGRAAIRLTDDELRDFLGSQVKVQVATIGPTGAPHLTTLFYAVQDDGRLAFWTYGRSQKIRNLERDPRVSCLVEDGRDYFELRGASLEGTAEIVRDPARIRDVGSRVAARMAGVAALSELGDLGELAAAEVERQAAKRVAVVVSPDHVATWDHRKIIEERP